MTRQKIEAVLRNHGMNSSCQCTQTPSLSATGKDVIDDLLALWTEPSRETLEKILDNIIPQICYQDSQGRSEIAECLQMRLVNQILTWARGEREQATWCQDICWKYREEGKSGWLLKDEGGPVSVAYSWKQCPICLVPRPAEAS